jgi:hypothetical protein
MNAMGVKLGNGWYSQEQLGGTNYGKYEKTLFNRAILFAILGPPRLLFNLNITFVNGAT